MFRFPPVSLVVCMLALLIALGGVGYSATGGLFVLGNTNSASTPTVLQGPIGTRTLQVNNGSAVPGATALKLIVLPGHPPMAVNSTSRVANLNADLLDGQDSGQLSTPAFTLIDADTSTDRGGVTSWTVPTLPSGEYAVTLSAGLLPSVGSAGAPNVGECFLWEPDSDSFWAEDSSPYFGTFVPLVSGADTITITEDIFLVVLCGVQDGTFQLYKPMQLSLVRLTSREITSAPSFLARPGRVGQRAVAR